MSDELQRDLFDGDPHLPAAPVPAAASAGAAIGLAVWTQRLEFWPPASRRLAAPSPKTSIGPWHNRLANRYHHPHDDCVTATG